MLEAYLDESYRLPDEDEEGRKIPQTFCVAGYLMTKAAAVELEAEWREALAPHGLEFFHMVECAHGNGDYAGIPLQERIDLVITLIALIKKYTVEGFALVASEATNEGFDRGADFYADFAVDAVGSIEMFLRNHRVDEPVSYFFESGHVGQSTAYGGIASRLAGTGKTVTFGDKQSLPLLGAGDLLAWQVRKYVQDWSVRPPRKDFLSLVQHPHNFFHLLEMEGERTMGHESWPMERRGQFAYTMSFDREGPVTFMRQGDVDTPIIPISSPIGWTEGAAKMAYLAFEDIGGKRFALAMDEFRLFELVLFCATALGELYDRMPVIEVDDIGVLEEAEDHIVVGVDLSVSPTRVAVQIPADVFKRFFWGREEREGDHGGPGAT